MSSSLANNTRPIVTEDDSLPGGHRPEVIIANELGIPGGPVTVEDGGDVALGATDDAAVTNPALAGSVISLLKGILTELVALNAIMTDIHDATDHSIRNTPTT